MKRLAYVAGSRSTSREQVERYLPGNYELVAEIDGGYLIYGEDVAGWGLDTYVIPRLQSGLIPCREVNIP